VFENSQTKDKSDRNYIKNAPAVQKMMCISHLWIEYKRKRNSSSFSTTVRGVVKNQNPVISPGFVVNYDLS